VTAQKITRKQLKQDGFVAWTEKALEYVQRNYLFLAVGLLVIVAALVGSSWYRQGRANAKLEASRLLYEGQTALVNDEYGLARGRLQECVDRYGGSRFALIARVDLARALHGSGESEAALATADEALQSLAEDDDLRANVLGVKAAILSDLERYAESAAALSEILSDPDLPDRQRGQLTMHLAESYERAGQPAEALRVLEELRAAIGRGEVTGKARNLDSRIEYYRALSRL
jgi:predicted negative regulator of RcsB-dependent stress response